MQNIRIPGRATYTRVALTDVMVAAPLAARVILGAFGPGQVVALAALGYYGASAAKDWYARRDVKYVDFQAEFGADVTTLETMPLHARRHEVARLVTALNAGFTPDELPRDELAVRVGKRLTAYLSTITDQEVMFSAEIRDFTVAKLIFPFALGAADPIGGDIAIFQRLGIFEPHVIAHEMCHRVGYLKELHAQVLAYLALRTSGDPILVQSARAERLHRQLAVLSRVEGQADPMKYRELLDALPLRPELRDAYHSLRPATAEGAVSRAMRTVYDKRMQLMGQNGLGDYDEGFTSLLWTLGRSTTARQPASHSDI